MVLKYSTTAATAGVAAVCAFAFAGPQVFAEFTSTSVNQNNSADAGTLDVDLVDASGQVFTTPIVTIANAMPGMSTKTSTIRLKNNGSLPASVRLHSANLVPLTTANLNSVLVVKVLDGSSNQLYSGTLSGLTLNLASIAAGSTTTLTMEITWPDLPAVDDNPYQDASLTFEIAADAASIAA